MLDREKQPTGLMHSGEQLRKLLLEYPNARRWIWRMNNDKD